MTPHQKTVDRYMEAFRKNDHAAVLACLTDDVEWVLPGVFHSRGKSEFDAHIEEPESAGPPDITVSRMIESGDLVVAEGSVRAPRKDAPILRVVFCDVFEMSDGRIRKLISYVMPAA